MKYMKIAQTGEVPEGTKKKVILEDKVLLLTNTHGTFYAIDNRCPHMGGSLFDGKLEGDHITCPKHGTVFDVKTGKVIQNGKLAFFKLSVNDAKSYPVKVEGADILVGIE
jgi:3-phenylpropionate/trans-cinnamate dioxygenase ferredoxin component